LLSTKSPALAPETLHSLDDKDKLANCLDSLAAISTNVTETELKQVDEFVKYYSYLNEMVEKGIYLEDFGFKIIQQKDLIDIEKHQPLIDLEKNTSAHLKKLRNASAGGFILCLISYFIPVVNFIAIPSLFFCIYLFISMSVRLLKPKSIEDAQKKYDSLLSTIKISNRQATAFNKGLEEKNSAIENESTKKAKEHLYKGAKLMERCNAYLGFHKEAQVLCPLLEDKKEISLHRKTLNS